MSTETDEQRARLAGSFGGAAADYDRLRPTATPAALDRLLATTPADGTVLDLAAGTGLLTRLVRERGFDVVAVEPDDRMRAVLAEATPGADVRAGTAEAIPLADASVDTVLAASAWHWFDAEKAVVEIGRVLRPGGVLGLLWSYPEPDVDWVRALRTIAHPDRMWPGLDRAHRPFALPADAPFGPGERETFPRTGSMSRDDLADMVLTYSRVLTLPADERAQVRARARAFLDERPELGDDDPVAVPFTTLVWSAVRD